MLSVAKQNITGCFIKIQNLFFFFTQVVFRTEIYGTFRQSVVFGFGADPVIVRELCVDSCTISDIDKLTVPLTLPSIEMPFTPQSRSPLTVRLISDSVTDVSIYKIGKLGSFDTHELSLRPGTYVAIGVRPGYRDVRLEFRVAPEVDMQPIVVRCEEQI